MILRCTVDGLLLDAVILNEESGVWIHDSGEWFRLEAVEAKYYELVSANTEELRRLQRDQIRLLRFAEDFDFAPV